MTVTLSWWMGLVAVEVLGWMFTAGVAAGTASKLNVFVLLRSLWVGFWWPYFLASAIFEDVKAGMG